MVRQFPAAPISSCRSPTSTTSSCLFSPICKVSRTCNCRGARSIRITDQYRDSLCQTAVILELPRSSFTAGRNTGIFMPAPSVALPGDCPAPQTRTTPPLRHLLATEDWCWSRVANAQSTLRRFSRSCSVKPGTRASTLRWHGNICTCFQRVIRRKSSGSLRLI